MHIRIPTNWRMPEVPSRTTDSRENSIDGSEARRTNNKEQLMRNRRDGIKVPTKWLMFHVEKDGWKHDRRHVHMTRKPEAASECLVPLVVPSDGAIKVGELLFAGKVPDEDDKTTEKEGTLGVDGTWIDPKLLDDGRKKGYGVHEETWHVRSCR